MFGSKKVHLEQSIKQVGVAIIGGGLIGGYMQGEAMKKGADTQSQAGLEAARLQAEASLQSANIQADAQRAAAQLAAKTTAATNAQQLGIYEHNVGLLDPWTTAGHQANARLGDLMGTSGFTNRAGYGSLAKSFGAGDLNANMAPSYQFMLDQGNQALAASAAARGGLLTGQGAKDIAQYNQNFASTGYQQAYNNFTNNQNLLYNKLSGISTTGENAAAQTGTMGTQVGSNIASTSMQGLGMQNAANMGAAGSLAAGQMGQANALSSGIMGAGNAQAGAQVGQGNAWSNALNQGLNNFVTMQYLKGITPAPQTQYTPPSVKPFEAPPTIG